MTTNSNHPPGRSSNNDLEHLRLLTVFHYIMAGLTALFSLFPLIHVGIGFMMVFHPDTIAKGQPPPPAFVGALFMGVGLFAILLGWCMATCIFFSGRFISERRRRLFSLIVGGILCIGFPFGTILGIFTILILSRESVQDLYRSQEQAS